MSDLVCAEIRHAYGPLLRDHDFNRETSPANQGTFATHSESVLTAVEEWLARFEDYASLRADQGRPLSTERRADLQRIYDALGRLLAANDRQSPAARLRALRLSQLAEQAGVSIPAGR